MKVFIFFLGLALIVFQNERITIKGKVVDNDNIGQPGVTVIETGTTNGTTTDINGFFTINIEKGANISFSYMGYDAVSIQINKGNMKGLNSIDNLVVNLEAGSLLFCCTNHHSESHCANTPNKMSKLSKEKSCTF